MIDAKISSKHAPNVHKRLAGSRDVLMLYEDNELLCGKLSAMISKNKHRNTISQEKCVDPHVDKMQDINTTDHM